MLLLSIVADISEIVGGFCLGVPFLGIIFWSLAYIFGLVISLILGLWIFLKGARIFWTLSMSIIDLISGGILPARTLGIILTYLSSKIISKKVFLKRKKK